MPGAQSDYQWISIRDFTPGVTDNPGASYPAGSAQTTGTFRCIANRAGALTPLPLRTVPFNMPQDDLTALSSYAITGLYVPPVGLLPVPPTNFNPNIFPEHELFVTNEWLDATGHTRHILRRFRRYDSVGGGIANEQIKNTTSTGTTTVPAWRPTGTWFGTTRSDRSQGNNNSVNVVGLVPGIPVVIIMGIGYLTEFPDDQNPTSLTPYDILVDPALSALSMCCHQGRVVIQHITSYNHGPNTTEFMGENLSWTAWNNVINTFLQTPNVSFLAENPSGYQCLISMTANELFGVKGQGGVYITGDLPAGTPTALPMVIGADTQHTPTTCELGVVYGSAGSGVWVWTHGDTSAPISSQMQPDFWRVSTILPFDNFGGNITQFARCDDWILVPNNWIFDTNLKSWWRLEDPGIAQFRLMTSQWHYIYGSQSFYTNGNTSAIHMWDRRVPSTSYQWQSWPLWETVDNLVDMREIAIRATGTGTVTVNFAGEDASTATATFTVSSTGIPTLYRQPIRIQDSNISVQIVSTGGSVAPTVWECNIGYVQAQKETIRN